jgi:F0F1-type ATP synthase assembly protein I
MERQIQITVTDTSLLAERVIDYFKQHGFILSDNNKGILTFKQNSTLLEAWKTNPLKWESQIIITIVDNNVQASFYVYTDAQMNTKEEESVWQTFIENFENYLTNGNSSNEKLKSLILDSKKSRLPYLSLTIFGALLGGLLGLLCNKFFGHNSIIIGVLIGFFASVFLKWRINYVKTKNTQ